MPCREIAPGVIACSRGSDRARCQEPGCTRPHDVLCDYPLRGAKAGQTCDRKLCRAHAVHVGHDKDHCPAHARAEGRKA